jgi:hypothetical protein
MWSNASGSPRVNAATVAASIASDISARAGIGYSRSASLNLAEGRVSVRRIRRPEIIGCQPIGVTLGRPPRIGFPPRDR